MSFKVPEEYRVTGGVFGSSPRDGNNGFFLAKIQSFEVRIIASDGTGWEHVSVSFSNPEKTPSWSIMCQVKDLFWGPEDVVIQFHPRESEYVNFHKGCLHLWRQAGKNFQTPPSIMIGPR